MHQLKREEGDLVTVRASGTLTQEDYDRLVPAWRQLIAEDGAMRMLFIMEDFHGWEVGAAWDDLHFELSHASQLERVAMVGEKAWEKWLVKIGSLFAPEKVRYFDLADLPAAQRWVRAG